MQAAPVTLRCEGCGLVPPPLSVAQYPFRCAHAHKDDVDHLVAPVLDPTLVRWPNNTDERPFIRYRTLLHSYAAATALGFDDAMFVSLVQRLDEAITLVDGGSFRTTPMDRSWAVEQALNLDCELWIKDETGNVSGSHKGRHLFGVLLHLELINAARLEPHPPPSLTIASCGNAALAAAVLASAAHRELEVFVPTDAHPDVLAHLTVPGVRVHMVVREQGVAGDPTLRAFRRAVDRGALPFSCQGPECGLTLDGGRTLGFEVVDSGVGIDRVFIQVGGGALASSFARALTEAKALGVLQRLPRLMAVQSAAVAPLSRAYRRLVDEVQLRGSNLIFPGPIGDGLADQLRSPEVQPIVDAVLHEMTQHRSQWLPPWDRPQPCVAHGILDDETYDAIAVLRAMIATGGSPVVVDEDTLILAERSGTTAANIAVDATGSAGLAGVMTWRRNSGSLRGERVLVLFTGVKR